MIFGLSGPWRMPGKSFARLNFFFLPRQVLYKKIKMNNIDDGFWPITFMID